jgi:hypothetical protein
MTNFIFEAEKGTRVHRYGWGVTVFPNTINDRFWWCRHRRQWVSLDNNTHGLSTHAPCKTFKAFKRHIKKHQETLKGFTVVWVNRFDGHNVEVNL